MLDLIRPPFQTIPREYDRLHVPRPFKSRASRSHAAARCCARSVPHGPRRLGDMVGFFTKFMISAERARRRGRQMGNSFRGTGGKGTVRVTKSLRGRLDGCRDVGACAGERRLEFGGQFKRETCSRLPPPHGRSGLDRCAREVVGESARPRRVQASPSYRPAERQAKIWSRLISAGCNRRTRTTTPGPWGSRRGTVWPTLCWISAFCATACSSGAAPCGPPSSTLRRRMTAWTIPGSSKAWPKEARHAPKPLVCPRAASEHVASYTRPLVGKGDQATVRPKTRLQLLPDVVSVVRAGRVVSLACIIARGMGIHDDRIVTHLVWADDTWLLAGSPEHLAVMIQELRDAMQEKIGLLLRPEKCTIARFGPDSSRPPSSDLPEVLRTMPRAQGSTCLRVLGDFVQVGLEYETEWASRRSAAWKAYHLRRPLWGRKHHAPEKLRMLHLSVFPSLSLVRWVSSMDPAPAQLVPCSSACLVALSICGSESPRLGRSTGHDTHDMVGGEHRGVCWGAKPCAVFIGGLPNPTAGASVAESWDRMDVDGTKPCNENACMCWPTLGSPRTIGRRSRWTQRHGEMRRPILCAPSCGSVGCKPCRADD